MSDVVRLADLQAGLRSLQCDVHTAKLGRVVVYSDATGKATVQLMRRPKDRRGLPVLQPPIPSVPVLWLGLGALLGIKGTLMPGDDVLLLALDRDHSPYFATPASANAGPFDAKSDRMHSLSDVVAIPVHVRLQAVGVPARIRIGGPAAQFGVVRDGGGLEAALAAATTALSTAAGIAPPVTPILASHFTPVAAALLAVVQLLTVSTVVFTE